jgi:hypothetical protein
MTDTVDADRVSESAGDSAGELMWYAAYGSNMSAERLRCYLEGGCPPGGRRAQAGARDPSPPRASRPVRLPFRLRFAGRSAVWGGGKAFVTPASPGTWCFARAWLLRREQFEDLASQESGRILPGRIHGAAVCLRSLRRDGGLRLGDGPYDRVLDCGDLDEAPMATLTHPVRATHPVRLDARSPSPAYVRVLAQGLREGHGLSAEASAAYLATADGVIASADELVRLLTPPCGPTA